MANIVKVLIKKYLSLSNASLNKENLKSEHPLFLFQASLVKGNQISFSRTFWS